MENPRAEKVAVVDEVRDKLSNAEAAVLTEYRGLNVAALAELRRSLRQSGGEYKIYKNSLVRFAARDLGLDIEDLLTGPTAIAFIAGDPVGVAKALRDYSRTHPALVVKGGLLGTKVIGGSDVTALADLPSREQLLSQIAGLFAAPMQQFASLLDAVPRSFAYALQALIDKGGAPGAPSALVDEPVTPDTPDEPATDAQDTNPEIEPAEVTEEEPAASTDEPAEPSEES